MDSAASGLRWLDRNLERILIVIAYGTMSTIIFVEVIQRFAFHTQTPWSTTIPVYLFIWITWLGASWNVRLRSHLAFTELRARMPYWAQYACVNLDHILWIGFGLMVINYSVGIIELLHMNFAIVPGTDHVMQWWFYLAIPVGWSLLILRCVQNMVEDARRFWRQEPFVTIGAIAAN
ncbi:TRAP transporter small permease [Azospirillum sp. RWY-5-1]|uniref:TRAP transporter small permease protein n=1 Tax=Azospirillum oleiclasticum TaxID=2735135 RepID=A0ABX2TH67_9PROT|nr:TRAP transporter small permease [Azospirillum oleiclasticum]NYZ18006.1 TRAP transporter small permease [Azospirillum oleiclasticum]NYZ23412.1 TRAP transporter small permease [Azospirillum oleiclasticum]